MADMAEITAQQFVDLMTAAVSFVRGLGEPEPGLGSVELQRELDDLDSDLARAAKRLTRPPRADVFLSPEVAFLVLGLAVSKNGTDLLAQLELDPRTAHDALELIRRGTHDRTFRWMNVADERRLSSYWMSPHWPELFNEEVDRDTDDEGVRLSDEQEEELVKLQESHDWSDQDVRVIREVVHAIGEAKGRDLMIVIDQSMMMVQEGTIEKRMIMRTIAALSCSSNYYDLTDIKGELSHLVTLDRVVQKGSIVFIDDSVLEGSQEISELLEEKVSKREYTVVVLTKSPDQIEQAFDLLDRHDLIRVIDDSEEVGVVALAPAVDVPGDDVEAAGEEPDEVVPEPAMLIRDQRRTRGAHEFDLDGYARQKGWTDDVKGVVSSMIKIVERWGEVSRGGIIIMEGVPDGYKGREMIAAVAEASGRREYNLLDQTVQMAKLTIESTPRGIMLVSHAMIDEAYSGFMGIDKEHPLIKAMSAGVVVIYTKSADETLELIPEIYHIGVRKVQFPTSLRESDGSSPRLSRGAGVGGRLGTRRSAKDREVRRQPELVPGSSLGGGLAMGTMFRSPEANYGGQVGALSVPIGQESIIGNTVIAVQPEFVQKREAAKHESNKSRPHLVKDSEIKRSERQNLSYLKTVNHRVFRQWLKKQFRQLSRQIKSDLRLNRRERLQILRTLERGQKGRARQLLRNKLQSRVGGSPAGVTPHLALGTSAAVFARTVRSPVMAMLVR